MNAVQANSGRQEPPTGGLYPTPPFSWLAPVWAFACGVAASSGATATGNHLLLFALGLLLVGPLLGTVWRASGQMRFRRRQTENGSAEPPTRAVASVPYTRSGSASEHLASWLGGIAGRFGQIEEESATPLRELAVSAVFAIALAAQLGQRTLVLALAALVCACVRSFGRGRLATNALISISVPVFVNWLIGHAVYTSLRPGSALVAACFALTLYGCSQADKTGKGPLRQLLPQAVTVGYLIVVRQPLVAAICTLLISAQLLWAPLLETQEGRQAYFRAVQAPLAISMLLSAWVAGYWP